MPQSQSTDYIGFLAWYSVDNDCKVGYEDFRELIKEHEAPLTIMKRPKPENVFRRACEKFSFRNINGMSEQTFHIEDNGFFKDTVSRTLKVSRDVSGKTETQSIQAIELDKKSKEIIWPSTTTPLFTESVEEGIQAAKKFIADYMLENAELLYSLPIRESIRRAIEGPLHGISMKPSAGAVYFVPIVNADDFKAMCQVINQIDGANVESVHTSSQDLMLVEYYFNLFYESQVASIGGQIEALASLLETAEVVPAKKFSEIQELLDNLGLHLASYDWIKDQVYAEVLDEMQKELDNLLSKVESDE